ncbi:MAG: hypothetical protein D8M59_07775 [Planctomycetes bacterium]|nr:hypothetical protein [Planctomycetota bacterium]NOG53222.1 hypothetical protein [Planctomycetota bacterium]
MLLRTLRNSLYLSILLTAVASAAPPNAALYRVTDLGAVGRTNVAWSLNQVGDVAGWSRFDDGTSEGFLYSSGMLDYVGFIGGTSVSNVAAVNNLGHGIGTSGTTHEDRRAFIWNGNHRTNLGTLGGDHSQGNGINDLDQAVGWSKLADNFSTRAFIWDDGVMSALPTLGGEQASARWINNAGTIVGTSTDDPNSLQQYGVVWQDGLIAPLPPFGEANVPYYIHENGNIAGFARLPDLGGKTRGVIWHNGEIVLTLGTLADGTPFEGSASSVAYGINDRGVIVGMSINATGDGYVPFVSRHGVMIQLDDLMPEPWVATNVGPGAINDAGQIAVEAVNGDGTSHALLLTPRIQLSRIAERK